MFDVMIFVLMMNVDFGVFRCSIVDVILFGVLNWLIGMRFLILLVVVLSVVVLRLSLLYSGVCMGFGFIMFMCMLCGSSFVDSVFVNELMVVLFVVYIDELGILICVLIELLIMIDVL